MQDRLIPLDLAPEAKRKKAAPGYAVSPSHSGYGQVRIPDWYADDPPTDDEVEGQARVRDQALLEWQQAVKAYKAAHEGPPVCWATWREAKEYDRQMREATREQREALHEAGEKYVRMCCVKSINDRPPTPGSPGAIALEDARLRRRLRPQLPGLQEDQDTEQED